MPSKTITIESGDIVVDELRMCHLRQLYNLPSDDALGSMLIVLEGSTGLTDTDISAMRGSELKIISEAVKEVNTPFLEALRTMNSPEMAESLSKIIDGIFFAPFLRSSAADMATPSGDTATPSS